MKRRLLITALILFLFIFAACSNAGTKTSNNENTKEIAIAMDALIADYVYDAYSIFNATTDGIEADINELNNIFNELITVANENEEASEFAVAAATVVSDYSTIINDSVSIALGSLDEISIPEEELIIDGEKFLDERNNYLINAGLTADEILELYKTNPVFPLAW
jgi:hypothetical protein